MSISLPLAQSKQDQVLQAINDSVGSTLDTTLLLLCFGVVAGLLIGLAAVQHYLNRRDSVPVVKQVFRNPRKLMREVAEEMELSPGELRKLEHHADRLGVDNPLTLMLCPSLLKKQKSQVAPGKK